MEAVPAEASGMRSPPANPDPTMYREQPLTQEERNRAANTGIKESIWVPLENTHVPGRFEPRSLRDLRGYRPTQLDFTLQHPEQDRKDEWFEHLLADLFHRVSDFCRETFGQGPKELLASYSASPWAARFSPQFVSFASQIARQDNHVGGWDHCLKDRDERTYLVMGIIAKILDENVFSELLFGVDEDSKRLLKTMDEQMLQEEGS